MQHSTTTKQRDILNTQNNIENNPNSNSSQLISKDPIQNTPFWIVGTEETGFMGVMGKYKITENFKTKDEALQELIKQDWATIINVVSIIVQETVAHELRQKAEKASL